MKNEKRYQRVKAIILGLIFTAILFGFALLLGYHDDFIGASIANINFFGIFLIWEVAHEERQDD